MCECCWWSMLLLPTNVRFLCECCAYSACIHKTSWLAVCWPVVTKLDARWITVDYPMCSNYRIFIVGTQFHTTYTLIVQHWATGFGESVYCIRSNAISPPGVQLWWRKVEASGWLSMTGFSALGFVKCWHFWLGKVIRPGKMCRLFQRLFCIKWRQKFEGHDDYDA